VLHRWFAEAFPDPSEWFGARLRFARTAAVSSVAGYLVGLGDRHGENLLVCERTGALVHVDFSCLFDKGLTLATPERVPFRLTQNVIDGFGVAGADGVYRRAGEVTLATARAHSAELLNVLDEAFPQPLKLRPYSVLATGRACGLIEAVVGARSIDHLKKRCPPNSCSLHSIFRQRWADDPRQMARARLAFLHSLAAYSIASYLLAIRDRHNGNLLLADDGSVVHIDFGFALGISPGGRVGPETSAPFKLTAEMVEILGGPESELFKSDFPRLCTLALRAARTRARTLLTLVEVMSLRPSLRCFVGAGSAPLEGLRARLMLDVPDAELPARVQELIDRSHDALGPAAYDRYQQLRNGIRA
jgi:phosphatidylinositol kinase/protein kinase (PI-3  family)